MFEKLLRQLAVLGIVRDPEHGAMFSECPSSENGRRIASRIFDATVAACPGSGTR